MQIACTAKVAKLIPFEIPKDVAHDASSIFGWHCNLYTFNRKRYLVALNNKTGFPVILHAPKKKDFANLAQVLKEAIVSALRYWGMKEEWIEAYFERAGEVVLNASTNRSVNSAFTPWHAHFDAILSNCVVSIFSPTALHQNHLSYFMRNHFLRRGFVAKMVEASFCELFGITPDELWLIQHAELKIELQLAGHKIWRRIRVPSVTSLSDLHSNIQLCFGWNGSHCHEFFIAKNPELSADYQNRIPIITADDESTLEFLNPQSIFMNDMDMTVGEIFNNREELFYTYDFGDEWNHRITLESIVTATYRYPELLEMKGECPPDDVGGEPGFDYFLHIMSDPSHPDYECQSEWYESQIQHRCHSMEEINQRLKGWCHSSFNVNVLTID